MKGGNEKRRELSANTIKLGEVATMKHPRSKVMIAILIVGLLAAAIVWNVKRQENSMAGSFPAPNMETCELGEDYYYLPEDYVIEGKVIYKAGYYEGILIEENSDYKIFVPVDPDTLERLPSDHFSDGTTLELPNGKVYELHITDGDYHAELKK